MKISEIINKTNKRYAEAASHFSHYFKEQDADIFSAPGRTEICGNHTDHQRGKVIAAAVDLDIIGIAAKTDDNIIRLKSKGHEMEIVDLNSTAPVPEERGKSAALIRGICSRLNELGFKVGGFNAYTTSNIPIGSGLSSSAAFEVLCGTIISHLYNGGQIDKITIAMCGQYAENEYFGKPCGLMDQLTGAAGGFISIDFENSDKPLIEKIDFDFASAGHALCIVNTGGNHADLTNEYAAITLEMKSVAGYFDKQYLCQVNEKDFWDCINTLRKQCGERAVLRASHFFAENQRVDDIKKALKNNDFDEFLSIINKSGQSSFMYLQNVYASPFEQKLSTALALSQHLLGNKGAFRVHGGGFAGTIQAFVPLDMLETYRSGIEKVFGPGSCHVLSVRPYGGACINELY